MATLEKIRQRAGVLVAVIIGLALLAFIMGDMLRSGSSLFRNSQLEIAVVAGHSIPVQTYQQRLEKSIENYKRNTRQSSLDEATRDQIQEQTWNDLIKENVMKDEYEEVGLSVSPEELFDMVQGKNIHPSIKEVPIFKDQTGQFDPALVIQFLKNLDQDQTGNLRASWLEFEKSIQQERLSQKFNTLIKKGLYVTSDKANEEANYRATKVAFDYVGLKLNEIPDSLLTVTDSDLETYYDEHKEEYKQKNARKLEYVVFDIVPSEEDDLLAQKWIEDIKQEFMDAENDKQFTNLNGDTGFDDKYYKQGEYNNAIDNFSFSAKIGDVYGPYNESGTYKLAKLTSIKYLPDSVRARHILIRPDEKTNDISAAQKMVDSLKQLVLNGADFATLANKYGSDGTAAKGGDLGWFTPEKMVQPFSDTCFFAAKGHITTVVTQHGVHLVQVTDKGKSVKKVQVAILDREVTPSNKTIQFIYQQASQFGGENNTMEKFENAINENGMTKKITPPLGINDKKISGLQNPREMIRWAFNNELGAVSQVFELTDKFVVAVITEVDEEGVAPLDKIRLQLENVVKREKAKDYLYEKFMSQIVGSNGLDDLASKLNTEVKSIKPTTFTNFSVPGLGVENEVIANAMKLKEGEQSGVIKGNNGVYIIKVTSIENGEPVETEKEKSTLIKSYESRVDYQTFETLKQSADIVDKRYKFY